MYQYRRRINLFALAMVVFLISIRNISELHGMTMLHDEFGYWANAAFFAGYDWSGIAFISPYYSYGYSILLTPLFWLADTPIVMYRTAIALNGVFYAGAFLLSYWCGKKLYPQAKKWMVMLVCFVVSLYCNNLVQTNMAWAEALLYFLFWALLATMMQYVNTGRLRWLLAVCLEIVYMYMVHQRTLGVLVAVAFTIILRLAMRHKKEAKKIAIAAAAIVCMLGIGALVKHYLQDNMWMWQDAEVAGRNDYSGQLEKVMALITSRDGIKNFFLSLGGKVFYVLVCGCGLVYWSVLELVKYLKRKQGDLYNYTSVFLLLSFLFTTGIVTIYVAGAGTRVDTLMYGRYTEFLIGPFLMLGLLRLLLCKSTWVQYLGFAALLHACGIVVYGDLEGRTVFTQLQSVAAGIFFDIETSIYRMGLALAVILLLSFVMYLLNRSGKKWLGICSCGVIVLFWHVCAENAIALEITPCQEWIKNISYVSDAIEAIDKDLPIYFIQDETQAHVNWRIENLQYLMPEKKICQIERSQLQNIEEEYLLLQFSTAGIDLSEYLIVSQGCGLILYAPKGTDVAERGEDYAKENKYVFSDTMMLSATGKSEYTHESGYKEGLVVFYQNLTLSEGTYKAFMDVKATNLSGGTDEGIVGIYDVTVNGGAQVLYSNYLYASELSSDGSIHLEFEFIGEEPMEYVEIRYYTMGNSKTKISNVGIVRE